MNHTRRNTNRVRHHFFGRPSLSAPLSLLLSACLSLVHGKDDSPRLLKLADKPPESLIPVCAPTRDSLASLLISKHDWNPEEAPKEFSQTGKLATRSGELEILGLNSGASMPGLEYVQFLVWPKAKGLCAVALKTQPPASNDSRPSVALADFSATPVADVYQIKFTSGLEQLNHLAENIEATITNRVSQAITLIQFNGASELRFLAADIPVYDSGDGTRRKTKPHELALKLDPSGTLDIAAGANPPTKLQKKWLGRYGLAVQGPANAAAADTGLPKLQAAHKTATSLFKSGKPGPAADTLGKALPSTARLTTATLPIANDLGFFLVEAKRYAEGAKILESVLAADSNRTVAYLNLGDAYAGAGKAAEAKAKYRIYCDRMTKDGKASKIPARVKSILSKS
jgi:hypothetical protein